MVTVINAISKIFSENILDIALITVTKIVYNPHVQKVKIGYPSDECYVCEGKCSWDGGKYKFDGYGWGATKFSNYYDHLLNGFAYWILIIRNHNIWYDICKVK